MLSFCMLYLRCVLIALRTIIALNNRLNITYWKLHQLVNVITLMTICYPLNVVHTSYGHN